MTFKPKPCVKKIMAIVLKIVRKLIVRLESSDQQHALEDYIEESLRYNHANGCIFLALYRVRSAVAYS